VVGGTRVSHPVGDRRGGVSFMVLKEPVWDCGSHSLPTMSRTAAEVVELEEEAEAPEEA
jgi:hypothetical protein